MIPLAAYSPAKVQDSLAISEDGHYLYILVCREYDEMLKMVNDFVSLLLKVEW